MSIFVPVNALVGQTFSEGVEFVSRSEVNFGGQVELHGRTTFESRSDVSFLRWMGAVTFSSQAAVYFTGPERFGAIEFESACVVSFAGMARYAAGVSFASRAEVQFRGFVDRAQDFGFTFFVDIQSASLSAALSKNVRSYTGRLIVDGEAVPILRAEVDSSDKALGVELKVVLARPDVSQIALDSTISFDIGIWTGVAWEWITYLTGAQLSSRGARYANSEGLPADSVEITFVDVMGDRWNRAPGAPTTLYDPQTVDAPSSDTISSQTIYDLQGVGIVPYYQAISGMRFSDVLEAAYVEGCGFDSVITNIDNFPIEEIAFTLTGGYDGGVRPFLAPYDPIFRVEGNSLWIVTLDNPLPAGFAAREFAASNLESADDSLPAREPVNALLVHLKDTGKGEYFTEEVETWTERAGTFGTTGYTETDVERRVRKYRNFLTPTKVEREEEVYLKRRTLDYQFNEISIDEIAHAFDSLNRPTGYTRTLHSLLPDVTDPNGALTLQKSEEETQSIRYGAHPLYPERDVQKEIVTTQSGLILTNNDDLYLDKPYMIPLRDAHKSGYVNADADQETSFGAIKTVTETMRVAGGQVFRDRQVTNHISNIVEPPTSQVFPGDASFDRRREVRARTVLLTIAGSGASGRRMTEFDVTSLPPDVGMKLAQKRLERLNDPPRDLNGTMPFIDPSMRKGLDLNVRGRGGASLGTYIVRGYSLTLEMNSEGVVEGKMNFTARELK